MQMLASNSLNHSCPTCRAPIPTDAIGTLPQSNRRLHRRRRHTPSQVVSQERVVNEEFWLRVPSELEAQRARFELQQREFNRAHRQFNLQYEQFERNQRRRERDEERRLRHLERRLQRNRARRRRLLDSEADAS